jgi:hypothetical protein
VLVLSSVGRYTAPYWRGRGFDTGEMDEVLVEVVFVVDVEGSLVRVEGDGGGSFVSLLPVRDLGRKTEERRDLRVGLGFGVVAAISGSRGGEVKVGVPQLNEVCSRDNDAIERRRRRKGEARSTCK